MNNPLLAAAVASMVLVGAGLAWRAGGPPGRPLDWATPVRVVVLGFLVLEGIGAVAMAARGRGVGGMLLIGGAFLAFGVATSIVARVAGRPAPIDPVATVGRLSVVSVVALAGVGLTMYVWLAVDHGVPLLSGDAQASRAGWAGIRLDLFRWLVPPAALVALGIALATRRRDATVVAIVSLAGVAVLEVLAASRALPLELGLAALLIAWWAGRRLRLRTWLLVGAATGLLFLGVLFARIAPGGGFAGPLDAIDFAASRTIDRVVMIQPKTIDIVVRSFPRRRDYMMGGTYVRWLSPIVGTTPPRALGSYLFGRLFPEEPPGGFVTPGLLGEGYANFGPVFALALMAGLGLLAAAFGTWLPRAPTDAATRTLAALIVVALLRTYATSLNGLLLTVVAAVGWWLLASGRLGDMLRKAARQRARGTEVPHPT